MKPSIPASTGTAPASKPPAAAGAQEPRPSATQAPAAKRLRASEQAGAIGPRAAAPAAGSSVTRAGTVFAPATATGLAINAALKATAGKKDASFLVMSYSPTGGGHTARTLNVVEHALTAGELKPGSTVLMYVPDKWTDMHSRSSQLGELAVKLKSNGINVVMAGADKSVKGFLKPEGASDDAKILDRLAREIPQRKAADISSVTDAKLFEDKDDYLELPTISAKDLMASLKAVIGEKAMATKVRVLTDTEPSLQKAAAAHGVPHDHRVEQENHSVLFDLENPASNLTPANAWITKVLGGHGELVSNIGMGDKNTQLAMVPTADKFGITERTSKADARLKVATALLGRGITHAGTGLNFEGIVAGHSVASAADVRNIVYVYAHNNTPAIEAQVRKGVQENHPAYANTLFVFAGRGTIPGENALHMAYLAEADGITTAGLGTNGEFSYLHKSGNSQAGLMVLPIHGHNEQEANARALATEPSTAPFVTNHTDPDAARLPDAVHAYLQRRADAAAAKYGSGDMSAILGAIKETSTYTQQTAEMLYGKLTEDDPAVTTGRQISQLLSSAQASPVLDANRKFLKVVLQSLDALAAPGADAGTQRLQVTLTQKEGAKDVGTLHDLVATLNDGAKLKQLLGSTVEVNKDNIMGLEETREVFSAVLKGDRGAADRIKALKESLGEQAKTGF